MYEDGLALLNEPAAIKAALPIAYVLDQADIYVYEGEGRLTALCPFHNDRNPSFDVFEYNGLQRWGCWSCGLSGDVFDLIQRLWPTYSGFRASVSAAQRALAKMQAEGWTGPKLRDPLGWDAEAAEALWDQAGWDGLDQLISAKNWKLDPMWLWANWHVRTKGSEALVPFWNEDNWMTAMKHRPLNGSRPLISLPGSMLTNVLYGEWKKDTGGTILLCEGESDCWHASAHLPEYRVLGIPAGAGATPTSLQTFIGRTVVIAFDGDDAGRLGRERWKQALWQVDAVIQFMDIPEGKDLTQCLS